MNPKNVISWGILALALALAFAIVYDTIKPDVRLISSAELMEAGKTPEGDQAYFYMGQGGLDDVIKIIVPVLVTAVGFVLKGGKKE